MWKSSTTRKRDEKQNGSEKHDVNEADVHEREDVDVPVTVVVRILQTEFETRLVDAPRPVLADHEPREEEEIEDSIGEIGPVCKRRARSGTEGKNNRKSCAPFSGSSS